MTQQAEKLLEHGLKDMYDAEQRFAESLGKMARNANDKTLTQSFEQHQDVTQKQVERIEQAFREMGKTPQREECAAAKGLVEEYEKFVEEEGTTDGLHDTFSATAGAKVEQYEIASYRAMIDLAEFLDLDKVSSLLKKTLAEEERTAAQMASAATSFGAKLAGVSAAKVAVRGVGTYVDTLRESTLKTVGSAGAVATRATGRVREAGERRRKSDARKATRKAGSGTRKAKSTARKAKSSARSGARSARSSTSSKRTSGSRTKRTTGSRTKRIGARSSGRRTSR